MIGNLDSLISRQIFGTRTDKTTEQKYFVKWVKSGIVGQSTLRQGFRYLKAL